jgi:hypothetical protein
MANEADRENMLVIRWRLRGQTKLLAPSLSHVYPVEDATAFSEALEAIDAAERKVWGGIDLPAEPTG